MTARATAHVTPMMMKSVGVRSSGPNVVVVELGTGVVPDSSSVVSAEDNGGSVVDAETKAPHSDRNTNERSATFSMIAQKLKDPCY